MRKLAVIGLIGLVAGAAVAQPNSSEFQKQVQTTNQLAPVVYNIAPYRDLFEKLQLNQTQTKTWERVVRAHQTKLRTMQGSFHALEAVGTLGRIREEIMGMRHLSAPLDSVQRVSQEGLKLAGILRSMEGVEAALSSFYGVLTPYQQRDFEIHQVEMVAREQGQLERKP